MVRTDVTTHISRPVDEVWDFVTDLSNSPRWTASGSELRQTSDGPIGLGATIVSVREVLGRELTSQAMVVTEYEPGRLLTFTSDVVVLGHTSGALTFETEAGGTRLSRRTEVNLGGAAGVLGPLVARLLRAGQGRELSNLKRLLEART